MTQLVRSGKSVNLSRYIRKEEALTMFPTKIESETKYIDAIGDTMQGILDMGIHKIVNVEDPTNATDAVNMKTLEPLKTSLSDLTASLSKVSNQHSNHFTYGTKSLEMHKNIEMNNNKVVELGNPTADKHAANKNIC